MEIYPSASPVRRRVVALDTATSMLSGKAPNLDIFPGTATKRKTGWWFNPKSMGISINIPIKMHGIPR